MSESETQWTPSQELIETCQDGTYMEVVTDDGFDIRTLEPEVIDKVLQVAVESGELVVAKDLTCKKCGEPYADQ